MVLQCYWKGSCIFTGSKNVLKEQGEKKKGNQFLRNSIIFLMAHDRRLNVIY